MTKASNRTIMLLLVVGLLLESAMAMVTRANSDRIFQGRARPSPVSTPISVASKSTNLFPARSHRSAQSAMASPLFSSSASVVGTMGSLVNPFKRSILSLRGGGTAGLATITTVAKGILDDVAASKTKSWACLVLAILLETFASTLSKRARDTANPVLFGTAISINLLSMCAFCTCLAKLDVGVAYAVWAAMGTIIVTTAGILFFQETCDPFKLISILFVVIGVVGLNLRG